jgi:hypothetical protein
MGASFIASIDVVLPDFFRREENIMRLKTCASVAVIAFSSLTASATTTTPVAVTGPSFSEVELATLTLTERAHVSGAVGYAPYVLIAPGVQVALPPVSFSTISAYNAVRSLTTFAAWSGNNFTFSDLDAGSYSLRTAGQVQGSNFVAVQFTVIPVPEPGTYAMLLGGLGVLGVVSRRRRVNAAVGAAA